MLCEERGFFLEIADIIRGMGLTILKGVMESRNDKIWARFAVEVNYPLYFPSGYIYIFLSCLVFLVGIELMLLVYLDYCIYGHYLG